MKAENITTDKKAEISPKSFTVKDSLTQDTINKLMDIKMRLEGKTPIMTVDGVDLGYLHKYEK